ADGGRRARAGTAHQGARRSGRAPPARLRQPALRRQLREAVSRPRRFLPRSHSRRQSRPDGGRAPLRSRAERQVHHLRGVVGAAGHHARALRADARVFAAAEALRRRGPVRTRGGRAHRAARSLPDDDGDCAGSGHLGGGRGRADADRDERRVAQRPRGRCARRIGRPRDWGSDRTGDRAARRRRVDPCGRGRAYSRRPRRAGRERARGRPAALRPRPRRRTAHAPGGRRRARTVARAHPPDRSAREGEAAAIEARRRVAQLPELTAGVQSVIPMPCDLCDDTGWKAVTTGGVRRVVRCDCWLSDLAAKTLKSSGIPPRYQKCDLDSFRDYNDTLVRAVTKAKALAESFPVVEKGLLFLGQPGIGKTHLAVGILRRIVQRTGASAGFYDTRTLLSTIRSTYNAVVDRKSTRLNSSHVAISYAVFCLKKKK